MTIPKEQRIVSDKIRNAARGNLCTVRIPGICNADRETTVLAHLPAAGVALKGDDIEAAFACDNCHSVLDRRVPSHFTRDQLLVMHHEGAARTRRWLYDHGYIIVP